MSSHDLKPAQLKQLGKLLHQLQTDLEEQLVIGEAAAGIVNLDQTSVGRISRMDAMQQQSMAVSTRQKAALRLRKVKAALQAMTQDEYGYCRQCDETIAFNRLLAQPEAKLCLSCQDKADRQQ